jgi:hypothetical protein
MNYATDFKTVRDEVSPQEWQARLDLAACYRLVDAYGMTDLIYNHITARIPGSDDHLLINLYGLLYKEITASSLVKIDLEGNIIWKPDTDYGINPSGYVIHSAIHRARPEVECVLHARAWRSRPWPAGSCRCRRPRSGFMATSAIMITRVRQSTSPSARRWCAISVPTTL